jgi:hypothetical protein
MYVMLNLAAILGFVHLSAEASKNLHGNCLRTLLLAPLSWFLATLTSPTCHSPHFILSDSGSSRRFPAGYCLVFQAIWPSWTRNSLST